MNLKGSFREWRATQCIRSTAGRVDQLYTPAQALLVLPRGEQLFATFLLLDASRVTVWPTCISNARQIRNGEGEEKMYYRREFSRWDSTLPGFYLVIYLFQYLCQSQVKGIEKEVCGTRKTFNYQSSKIDEKNKDGKIPSLGTGFENWVYTLGSKVLALSEEVCIDLGSTAGNKSEHFFKIKKRNLSINTKNNTKKSTVQGRAAHILSRASIWRKTP